MKLGDAAYKADSLLREALRNAQGGEKLRAVVLLREDAPESDASPDPAAFETRSEWQKAMIRQRKAKVAQSTKNTRDELQRLDLHLMGGSFSRALVVEGTADRLRPH